MKEFNFIRTKFLERHQEIDSNEYLDKYINFLINYNPPESEKFQYFEKHHILPKSAFPEYKDEDWNITELEYGDHRLVHLWLFKSINTRQYQRPLNWMLNQYKNKEEISRAARRGWVKLKNDPEKYDLWRNNRMSIEFKKIHFSSEKQRERANMVWNNITDDEYILFCKKMKDYWTEEKKLEKSIEMKKFYSDHNNVAKKSIESKKIWDERGDEFRDKFRDKMTQVNKNEEKRKMAGDKIKNLWLDEEYLEKMRNRKLRGGTKIKLINNNNEVVGIFETMRKFEESYHFSVYLIRKYKNSGNPISEIDLNEFNIVLKNCKIETIDG